MGQVTPCETCGKRLCDERNDDEPCWGEIQPVERRQWEAEGYVGEAYGHACEGHRCSMYRKQKD